MCVSFSSVPGLRSVHTQKLVCHPQMKHFYPIGPLLPRDDAALSGEKEITVTGFGDEVQSFLDDMMAQYGQHSVLYIR